MQASEIQLPPEAMAPQVDAMQAFLGALDDIAAKTPTPEVTDTDIIQRITGLFDTASTFYDPDTAKSMELVKSLAVRLGELACGGHNHASEALDVINEKFSKSDKKDKNKETHDPKGCKTCKAGKPCSRR